MLQAAEIAAQETASRMGRNPPLVLGVTVLTSLVQSDLADLGIATVLAQQVERLAASPTPESGPPKWRWFGRS